MEEKHIELNKTLDRLEKDGMEVTNSFIDMWTEALHYFFGDQLRGKKYHRRWDWVVVNYLWPTAMQEMAKLAKHHPKIIAHPGSEDDIEASEAWQAILQYMWEKGLSPRGMRLEQMAAILDSKIFGYRVSKVCWEDKPMNGWDEKQNQWIGDVQYMLVHPAMFWCSPDSESVEKADACGTSRWVRLEWAKKRWPEFAQELEEKSTEGLATTSGGMTVRGARSVAGSTDAIASGLSGGDSEGMTNQSLNMVVDIILGRSKMNTDVSQTSERIVKISEIYFRDDSEKKRKIEREVPVERLLEKGEASVGELGEVLDTNGKPIQRDKWPMEVVQEFDEPLYPYGRYVIRCEDIILNPETKKNPYAQRYPYKQWPYIVIPHYMLPHMWQGLNAVEMYKSAQDWINVSVSYLCNHLKMFGLPQYAIEDNALSMNPKNRKTYNIPTTAGGIIRVAKGAIKRIMRLDPPQMSSAIVPLYNMFTEEFKNLTGLHSVAQGQQERHKMTATESEHLMISAHDRIAIQAVFEEIWIKKIAGLAAEIAQARYDQGRWVRIIGQEHSQGSLQITQRLKEVAFDIEIEPGSTLPYDEEKRIQKFQLAYQLLSQPIPNPMLPAMLRELEIPNWKQLLAQYQGWVQYMQFMQMKQGIQEGKIDPRMAVQNLAQQVMQMAPQQKPQGGPPNA